MPKFNDAPGRLSVPSPDPDANKPFFNSGLSKMAAPEDFRPTPSTIGFEKAIFGHPPSPKDNPYYNWAASYIPPKLAGLVPDDGTGLAPHDSAFMNEEVNRILENLRPDLGIGYADEVVDATPRNMLSPKTRLPSDQMDTPKNNKKSSGLGKM